jgi:hypothetical protein
MIVAKSLQSCSIILPQLSCISFAALRESFCSLAAGLGVCPAEFALPHSRNHRRAFGPETRREPVKWVQKAACRILMRFQWLPEGK